MANTAKVAATSMPEAAPAASPTHGDPEAAAPHAAPKAPLSMMPSRPTLITPLRSATISPVAASASGVATRTAADRNPAASVARPASGPVTSPAPVEDHDQQDD